MTTLSQVPQSDEVLPAGTPIDVRWNAVLDALPAIGKDSKNTQQGFKYRSIVTVLDRLNPLFGRYGLHVVPVAQRAERDTRQTRNGGLLNVCYLTVDWEIRSVDGSVMNAQTLGEGTDAGDKATSKAQTMALKYLLWPTLVIAENEDPDGTTVEESVVTHERGNLEQQLEASVAQIGDQASTKQINYVRRLLRDAGYLSGADIEHFVRETLPDTEREWNGDVARLPRGSVGHLIDLLKPSTANGG